MIDKSKDLLSKSELPNFKKVEMDKPNLKLLYQNTTNSERDKNSGLSSDEDNTSSSLLALPKNLEQIRSELKSTFCDTGELSEVESSLTAFGAVDDSSEKVQRCLKELRRKYTLKNETSVALKMNSANLMLDDILGSSKTTDFLDNQQQLKLVREGSRKTIVAESETSTTESTISSKKICIQNPVRAVAPPSCSPIASRLQPVYFFKHSSRSSKTPCFCPNNTEKDTQTPEVSTGKRRRKKNLRERMQNLKIKYKIMSAYKMVHKSNLFSKNFKNIIQKGIPGSDYQESSRMTTGRPSGKPTGKPWTQLCLKEKSNLSRSDSNSLETKEECCTYPIKINYNCQNYKRCACLELTPKYICQNSLWRNFHEKNPPVLEKCNEHGRREFEPTANSNSPVTSLREKSSSLVLEDENNNVKNNEFSKGSQDWKKHCTKEKKSEADKTDIYYFDHGNSAYYQTTDNHPVRYTECLVERTDEYATMFWAEVFGVFEIGIAFLISFILQLYRFLFTSIIRSLTVGLLQIFSDYFFKPLLSVIFNGVIQPCLILAYNVATSLRDLCLPISQIFGFFAKEIAHMFRACRLVEVNSNHCNQPSCYCGNKV